MVEVSARARLAYAAPAFALAAVGIPVYVVLPKFYTDVVGVPVGLAGTVLVAARVFDAVTDPLMGWISDRSRTPWGRRRPYIAAFAPLLAISLVALFRPPEGGALPGAAWLGFWVFCTFLFWTAVTIPYESLGPELSRDFDERTAVLGLRDASLIAGTLAAAAAPGIAQAVMDLPPGAAGERLRFAWISSVQAGLLVALAAACVVGVSERPRAAAARRSSPGSWRDLARNRPFVILLASYTVSAFGSHLPATLILYYVEYVLHSDHANWFLLEYFVTGIAFLPLWVGFARRWGKKRAWIAAMALNTGAFSLVFGLGAGDEVAYAILVFLSGIGFGATLAIPSSMQADVIDYDELRTGERREGRYVGVWSIARKGAAALGVGAALWILGAVGYRPGMPQSAETELALRTLYALVPSICNALALAIALAYPLDRATHARIRAAIERRSHGAGLAGGRTWRPASETPR